MSVSQHDAVSAEQRYALWTIGMGDHTAVIGGPIIAEGSDWVAVDGAGRQFRAYAYICRPHEGARLLRRAAVLERQREVRTRAVNRRHERELRKMFPQKVM